MALSNGRVWTDFCLGVKILLQKIGVSGCNYEYRCGALMGLAID